MDPAQPSFQIIWGQLNPRCASKGDAQKVVIYAIDVCYLVHCNHRSYSIEPVGLLSQNLHLFIEENTRLSLPCRGFQCPFSQKYQQRQWFWRLLTLVPLFGPTSRGLALGSSTNAEAVPSPATPTVNLLELPLFVKKVELALQAEVNMKPEPAVGDISPPGLLSLSLEFNEAQEGTEWKWDQRNRGDFSSGSDHMGFLLHNSIDVAPPWHPYLRTSCGRCDAAQPSTAQRARSRVSFLLGLWPTISPLSSLSGRVGSNRALWMGPKFSVHVTLTYNLPEKQHN